MPREHLTATVDQGVMDKVRKRAKKEKRNVSNMIQVMIEFYLILNEKR
jgi:hypothetical protein